MPMWDRFALNGSRRHGLQIRVLYDELLQNFQGLVLSFDAAASRLPDSASRTMLDRTLERADVLLRDARINIQTIDAVGNSVDDGNIGRGHVEEHQPRGDPDPHRR